MTPSLADQGITINIMAPEPEQKFIIKQDCDWETAIELAKQCRIHHPKEPIEIIPVGDRFTVVKVVP